MAVIGSCALCTVALPKAKEPDTEPKATAPAKDGCKSNEDCKGGLVCVLRQGSEGQRARCEQPSSPDPNPRADLCPHAAKRMLDKAYGCGFSTVGLDETTVCAAMNYDRVIYLESLNCRELQNLLADAVGAK